MKDHDTEGKLRALIGEAHSADRPPSFRRTWDAARRIRATRGPVWAFIPALAAVGLLIVWSARPRPGSPPALQEIQAVEWSAGVTPRLRFATLGASGPLDFLLETPGSELLHTVPTFDTDRSFP